MTKLDWIRKLSSRKFWVTIVGFTTAILTAFNIDSMTIGQITSLISAMGILISYIVTEGIVDSARLKNEKNE